jgi:hypothetical protein
MKTTKSKTPRRSQETKRSFSWGIKTTDISFMRMTEAEAAMEGSSGGGDCSAISEFDSAKHKRPEPTGRR